MAAGPGRPARSATPNIVGSSQFCRCGSRGCLEAVISVTTVREQIAHTHSGLSRKKIPLGDEADAITRRILEDSGRQIGRVTSDLCNLVNPTAVISGNELGSSKQGFVDGVDDASRRFALPAAAEDLTVVGATLGTVEELRGAIDLPRISHSWRSA